MGEKISFIDLFGTELELEDEYAREMLADETAARAEDVAVLEARMDTFTALPAGSTAGDAELMDIRVGYDGTTYANAGDAVRGQGNTIQSTFNDNFQIYSSIKPSLESGKYIDASNNNIATQSDFSITEPIAVKKGQTVKLTAKGYRTVVGMIATCDAENTSRTTVVASIDDNVHEYIYNVIEDGYIVCSFYTAYNTTYKLELTIDYYTALQQFALMGVTEQGAESVFLEKYINGHYISNSGANIAQGNYFISQSIVLYPNQTLVLNAKGTNQTIAMISEYDETTDTYSPLVISVDSTQREYQYTATNKIVIRCCVQWYKSTYSANIVTNNDFSKMVFDNINDYVNNIETPDIVQYPQLFDNVLCIGDSLTVGYDGSGNTPLIKNYPHFIEKLMNAETALKAHGGWTTKQIWDNEISTATDLANYDCAIIFLGTNGDLTDTVDTDCYEDYTQNADTNTGCYGKIIGKIKTTAPKCKIFAVAGVNDYVRRATTMNPAVRSLAELYDVGLIDVENCIMSDTGGGSTEQRYLYRPIDGIHYNALGYMTLANLMYDSMSDFMKSHLSMYTT